MCGRYAASANQDLLEEAFEIDDVAGPLPSPSFNVAPTDLVPAVVERVIDGQLRRRLVPLRWGLVPSWSKTASGAARLINARLETVAEKPSFRRAFAVRRCLLPADGYYEWYVANQPGPQGKPVKQPFFIRPADGSLLAMAGLYEFWKTPDGAWLSTCTIITTAATDAVGRLHDRMPVTVARAGWASWLDPGFDGDPRAVLTVPALDLAAYAVSTAVNWVANDSPELIEPLPDRVSGNSSIPLPG
ncbi:MAG: SOS response-associated peptidase [Propionicimonas sp.]